MTHLLLTGTTKANDPHCFAAHSKNQTVADPVNPAEGEITLFTVFKPAICLNNWIGIETHKISQ